MAVATHINDGGTWRRIRRMFVNDGGLWREIRKAFVNDSGSWRLVYAAADQIVITSDFVDFNPTIPLTLTGYYTNVGLGAANPSVLASGYTLTGLYDLDSSTAVVAISGFSADPGQAFLESVAINSVTRLGSAASYFYSGGVAQWSWSGQPFGLWIGTYNAEIAVAG